MKSNCQRCNREIISGAKQDFCQNCQYENNLEILKREREQKIKKVEINLETIKKYMEKNLIFSFLFSPAASHKGMLPKGSVEICNWRDLGGWDGSKRIGRLEWNNRSKNSSSSAFVAKLIEWTEKEGVKKIEPIYNEDRWDNSGIYKIDDIYIEKWTAEEIRNNDASGWKCSDCKANGEVKGSFIEWCSNCGSKNIEVWYGGFHFTCSECPACHKVRDIKYHNTSNSSEAEELRKRAKRNWELYNELCSGCSLSNSKSYGNESRLQRENKNNSLPWILGGIILVSIIVGLIWYFTRKEDK